MGYFQNFFFFPSEKVIPPSLPRFLPFPPHFELCCMFLTNISAPISSTPAPFMFLHPTARHSRRMALGVSATTCCVQREGVVLRMHVLSLCVQLWKCAEEGAGTCWRSICTENWTGCTKFWLEVRVREAVGGWEIAIVIMCFNLVCWRTQTQWYNLIISHQSCLKKSLKC